MRVSFDTEIDSYEAVAATVRAAYGRDAQPAPPAVPAPGNDPPRVEPADAGVPGRWTRERLAEFARSLAPDAAEAVRYIAAHAPAVPLDEVIRHMAVHTGIDGFTGQQMGGRMASVGFTCKRMRMPPPLRVDSRSRQYRVDEDVAAVLREVLGAPRWGATRA